MTPLPPSGHVLTSRRVRLSWVLSSSLCLAASVFVPAQTGQAHEVTPLLGVWRNAESDGGEGRIEAAIRSGTDSMGPLRRRIAQRRIRRNNPPVHHLRIEHLSGQLRVHLGEGYSIGAPVDGSWAQATAPDGSDIEVSHVFDDGRLLQRAKSGSAAVESRYDMADDGRLLVTVTIHSSRLPSRPQYQLTFTRVR